MKLTNKNFLILILFYTINIFAEDVQNLVEAILLKKTNADIEDLLNQVEPQKLNEVVHGGFLSKLKYDSDMYLPINNQATPLTAAARTNNVYIADLLLKKGANINKRAAYNPLGGGWGSEGWDPTWGLTPLMTAAWAGNKEMVEFLLKNGANPNLELLIPYYLGKVTGPSIKIPGEIGMAVDFMLGMKFIKELSVEEIAVTDIYELRGKKDLKDKYPENTETSRQEIENLIKSYKKEAVKPELLIDSLYSFTMSLENLNNIITK